MQQHHVKHEQLISALADLLWQKEGGFSEYELLKQLQQEPYCLFDAEALSDELSLFQCHFILFNALYQLQQIWHQQQCASLNIHTLNICKKSFTPGATGLAQEDALMRYYLDWDNYRQTSAEDVAQLLESFWQQMAQKPTRALPGYAASLEILQLDGEGLTLVQLKKQYRKLQHIHHPDKGGERSQSQQLERAYHCVRRTLQGQ